MAQRQTHVPKFGNWNSEENIPYTAVFDHARAGKGVGGKIINPNDPEENPAAFDQIVQKNPDTEDSAISHRPPPPPRRASDSELNGPHVTKPRHERRTSREDGDFKRHVESPARYQYADPSARRAAGESPGHRYSGRTTTTGGSVRSNPGDLQRRAPNATRENSSSEHGIGEHHYQSVDQSPVHHQYQGRLGNKPGAASPAWDRKGSAEGGTMFAPATPSRSKLRGGNTRADETPDRGAPLPKFGAWNENDPASADGFTFIFNKAREEKQTGGAAKIPTLAPETQSHEGSFKQANGSPNKSSFWCCFSPKTID
eukprot:Gb_22705 [translate_table: standard]